ncbi:MAG TPA: zf-TFIIB domain-containing protein [Gemmatimonadales bacterium]|nr:zf-TFIIB domain-containing protein [Gemmatimonadales bacterium]
MSTDKPSHNEEEFFARQEAELLKEQRRRAIEAAAEAERRLHYHKCPKDGYDLVSEVFHGVTVERCPQCQGIWLEAHEVDAIVAHEDSTLLGRVFHDISATLRGRKAKP